MAEDKEMSTDNDSDSESLNSKVISYVVGFLILAIIYGGFQYYQLRTSVQETVQQILTDNTNVKYTIDGINLPITLVLASKVTADVFLKKTTDEILRIEVIVIPKDAIPILSIFISMEFMVEIPGTEMFKLQNS